MKFGITLPRNDIAGQPAPLKYLTELARECDRMGYAYCVMGEIEPLTQPGNNMLLCYQRVGILT